jgi:hypothetical protein
MSKIKSLEKIVFQLWESKSREFWRVLCRFELSAAVVGELPEIVEMEKRRRGRPRHTGCYFPIRISKYINSVPLASLTPVM